MEVNIFEGRERGEEVGLGIGVVSATDTVVNGNKELRRESKPKGTGGGGIVRVVETMGEEFLDPSEGLEGDGTLRSFGKFMELERVGDSDGVRIGSVFNGRIGEFAKGDRDGNFRNVGDVGIHVVRKRPWGGKGEREERRRQCE